MNAKHDISLNEAADLLPRRNGQKVSIQTLMRWIKQGCRGVKLSAWKWGGRWYTSPEELDLFRRRSRPASAPRRTPAQREAAIRAAREELRKDGFYDAPKRGRPQQQRNQHGTEASQPATS